MPVPTYPPSSISFSQIQAEFGGAAPISMAEYYGAAPGVPGGGTISVSQFSGASSGPAASKAVFLATNTSSPYAFAYTWADATGFGSRTTPGTAPTQGTLDVGVRDSGDVAVYCVTTSGLPLIRAYPWTAGAFGSPYSPPPAAGSFAKGVAFDRTGGELFVGLSGVGGPSMYAWSGGFGSLRSAPPSALVGSIYRIAVSRANGAVFVSGGGSPNLRAWSFTPGSGYGAPWVSAYPWSNGGGWGSKYAAPSAAEVNSFDGVAALDYGPGAVVVGRNGAPNINVYAWSDGSGFGSRAADPGTALGARAVQAVFTNGALVISAQTGSNVHAYAWAGAFGAKYANPGTAMAGAANSIRAGIV